jgi:hypothetical protein
MKTIPLSNSDAKSFCSLRSLVHALEPRPNVVSFASSTAALASAHAENSCNRAEDFFAVRRRLFRHIDENRGLVEKSRTVNSVAAGQ